MPPNMRPTPRTSTSSDITDDMLAFWGGIENSPVDPTLKAFIFIGNIALLVDVLGVGRIFGGIGDIGHRQLHVLMPMFTTARQK